MSLHVLHSPKQTADPYAVYQDAVLLHLDLTLLAGDASDCLATSKDEHLVVLLALLHDGLIIIKLFFFQHLCQRTDLILGQSGEDVATIQELAGLLKCKGQIL